MDNKSRHKKGKIMQNSEEIVVLRGKYNLGKQTILSSKDELVAHLARADFIELNTGEN